jgi:hypothetical protein
MRIAVLGLGVVLPLWLLASPPERPASAPALASRPAGIPLTIDQRSGVLMIGRPPAPVLPELFLFDGKRTSPAPPHMLAGDNIKVGGFTGKYPVPVGAGLSGPAAKRMWGIYADAALDASQVDRVKMRSLAMWHIVGSKGEALAAIAVSLAEESKFYISPQYVVYAGPTRKITESAPFATVTFPSGGSGVTLTRNGAKVEAGRSEEGGAVSYRLEKVSRTELLEWEIVGDRPAKGALCPILLSAEPGFVEYVIAIPPDRPATGPAPK